MTVTTDRVAVIVNPISGTGGRPELAKRRIADAEAALATRGLEGRVLVTERAGHGSELVREALAGGASLVVAWGPKNALSAAFLSHMLMWGLLLLFGLLLRFRVAYLTGLFIILISLLLEHWLARRRSLQWINIAFFRLNALISVVFLIVTVSEVIFRGGFRVR